MGSSPTTSAKEIYMDKYQCNICEEFFESKEYPYNCPLCKAIFCGNECCGVYAILIWDKDGYSLYNG